MTMKKFWLLKHKTQDIFHDKETKVLDSDLKGISLAINQRSRSVPLPKWSRSSIIASSPTNQCIGPLIAAFPPSRQWKVLQFIQFSVTSIALTGAIGHLGTDLHNNGLL
jgi:hypothetical protein